MLEYQEKVARGELHQTYNDPQPQTYRDDQATYSPSSTRAQGWRDRRPLVAFFLLLIQVGGLAVSLDKAGVISLDLNGIRFVAPEFTFGIVVYFIGLVPFVLIGALAIVMVGSARSKRWAALGTLIGVFNPTYGLHAINALYRVLS